MATDLLYLRDADLRTCTATVVAVDAEGRRLALDRTALYPTGGGQPHDTGTLAGLPVTDVRKEGEHGRPTPRLCRGERDRHPGGGCPAMRATGSRSR